MEAYTNMKITLSTEEMANKAVEIISRTLKTLTPEYEEELIRFEKDIFVENNAVVVEYSCSLCSIFGIIDVLAKAIATELADEEFELDSWYFSCNCGYQSTIKATYKDGTLTINTIEAESDGYCPECGEQIVCYDEYDPNETYYCPECGDELNHEDMFEDGLPTFKEEVIKIK